MEGMSSTDTLYDLPRVLVVENEPEPRQRLATLLKLWKYQAYVVEARGDDLLSQAIALARESCCHLALVDLRLKDDNDPQDLDGLRLIPHLRPAEVVIVSGYLDYRVIRDWVSAEHERVYFVGKEEGPERLKEELEKAARQICAAQRQLEISPRRLVRGLTKTFFPDDENIPVGEAADVLARLFPEAKKMRLRPIGNLGAQSLSRVPRPRSRTLIVYPDDLQPQVVKLARASKIKQEVARYQEHIEDRLVGHYSPPIKTWSALWNLGGAVYPFMGASSVETFATYYSHSSAEDIQYSLTQFFERTWSDLYRSARGQAERETKNLFVAYTEVWEPKWYQERVMNFPPLNPALLMPADYSAMAVPDPVTWLKTWVEHRRAIPATWLAVTHGDLHGDNILVDENRNVWAIDFERSGPGPVLQDFVELEADILTRLAGLAASDFHSLYRLGVWVAQSKKFHRLPDFLPGEDTHLLKIVEVIRALRQMAQKMTGERDARPYLWGLLLNMMFRATLVKRKRPWKNTTDLLGLQPSQVKALMLSSMLCHRLEHWGKPWPPAEWPEHNSL